MTPDRIFYFACKPGCDPVQVSGKTAHARLPWVAQGYEVFEWHWNVQYGANETLITEVERLYDFCGDRQAPPYPASLLGMELRRKVSVLIRAKTEQKPGNPTPPAATTDV